MIDLTALAASLGDTLGKRVPASYAIALSENVRAASGCADCGTREPVAALAFDHIDPATKYRTASGKAVHPADMVKASGDGSTRYALRTIIAEWAKCEVRCANCHALKTFPGRSRPRPLPASAGRDALVEEFLAAGGGEVRVQARTVPPEVHAIRRAWELWEARQWPRKR